MEVANAYTRFSARFSRSMKSKAPLDRGVSMTGYDIGEFDQVIYLQRTDRQGKNVNKVYFITDSNLETWRIARISTVCDIKRGDVNNQTGECQFFALQIEYMQRW